MNGNQGRRAGNHYFRTHFFQKVDITQCYAGMHDVSDDGYFFPFERTEFFPDGKGIEQSLRGMFIDTVTGIHDCGGNMFGQKMRSSAGTVPHHHHVHFHG